jgi:hypothetical protein
LWIVRVTPYRGWLVARAAWRTAIALAISVIAVAVAAATAGHLWDWPLKPVAGIVVCAVVWALVEYRIDRRDDRRALSTAEPLDPGATVVSPWRAVRRRTRPFLPRAVALLAFIVALDLVFDGDSVAWLPAAFGCGEAFTDLLLRRPVVRLEREEGREHYLVAGKGGRVAWLPAEAADSAPSAA